MSIANETLRSLEQKNDMMQFNHTVLDYKLNDMSERKKPTFRQWVIFIMLIVSLIVFFMESFTPQQAQPIVNQNPVSINDILVTKKFAGQYNYRSSTVSEMPKAVTDFIEYDLVASEEPVKEIVIYEIVDHTKINEQIKTLLAEADALFIKDHLTSPAVDNAFEKYEAVLDLDRNNSDAIAGIKNIVNRYIYFVESVIKKNETYKIPGLIRSAQKVGSNYMDMLPIIEKYKKYLDKETIFISLPKEPTSAGEQLSEVPQIDLERLTQEQPIVDADIEIAKVALKLWQQGDILSAQRVLEEFTNLTNYWGKAYDLLLKLYIEIDNLDAADNLVYKNKTLDLFQLAEKAARIFDARDDAQGAIDLLDSHNPVIDEYPGYYALKAGLYHKAGHYQQAADLYKRLLNITYENARYWLGLAVSLDAMGDDDAIRAFHFANQYAVSGSPVKQYIEQRILVLAH